MSVRIELSRRQIIFLDLFDGMSSVMDMGLWSDMTIGSMEAEERRDRSDWDMKK